VLNSS